MRKTSTETFAENTTTNRTTVKRQAAEVIPADTVKAYKPLELLISGRPFKFESPRQSVEVRIIDGRVHAQGVTKEAKVTVQETIIQENIVNTVDNQRVEERERKTTSWMLYLILGAFMGGILLGFLILRGI